MTEKLLKKEVSDPTAQERCIWMTAGVISFKLCPFEYNCELCDFDKIMRHQFNGRSLPINETPASKKPILSSRSDKSAPFFTFSVGEIPEECYFHLAHVWARPLEKEKWEIGIDPLLSYILPLPIGIEFNSTKRDLIQNEVLCKIVTTVGTIFLTTPLSGTLVSENPELALQPQLLQEDPLGKGWLAQIEWSQDSSELREFYTGSEAKRFLQEEACHLKHVLKYRGVEISQLGKTLPDGGTNIKYLHQILPAKFCMELSRALIASGKAIW